MKRDFTPDDLARITQSILGGDRVEATSIYISVTECGLTEAQKFVNALTAELRDTKPEKFSRKPQSKRNLWQRLIFSVNK
jgi:hypothetical protein